MGYVYVNEREKKRGREGEREVYYKKLEADSFHSLLPAICKLEIQEIQ